MNKLKNTFMYNMGKELVIETPGVKAIGIKGIKRSDVRVIYDKTKGHNIVELEEIHMEWMDKMEYIRRTLGEIFFGIKTDEKKSGEHDRK